MRFLMPLAAALATLVSAPALAQDPIAQAVEAIANDDTDSAGTILDDACKAGNMEACWRRGLLYANGYGDSDKAGADKQFLANCAHGEARSCYMVFKRTDYDASDKDKARGRVALGKACDGGLGYACADYANALQYDESAKASKATLAGLYEKACTLGSSTGCHEAGGIYGEIYGDDPIKDLAKGAALEGKACDLGNAEACGNIPAIEAAMLGDEQKPTDAMQARWQGLLQKACLMGEGNRCEEMLVGQLTAK